MAGQIGTDARRVTPWLRRDFSGSLGPMARTILLYALALGMAAVALEWLQYNYVVHTFSTEIYIGLIALGFAALGLWAGNRLTARPATGPFIRNDAAIRSLGLTARETEILGLLASGQSNKEMARRLDISPNTVKTHVASVYLKLEVQKRMQAVEKARMLAVIE
jgi:DNA-binding CsgD family transcriptional regulator